MSRRPHAMILAAALCAALAAASPTSAQGTGFESATPRTITVSATGEVGAAPDVAEITIGVATEGASAAEAMRANTAQMNALVAVLDAQGIVGRDRQTSSIEIVPDYRYEGPDNRARLAGYTARNTLCIRIRDLAETGDVLDALVEAGANQVNGIAFDVLDKAPLLDDARREAVMMARRKAEVLADSAGVALGPIARITEGSPQQMPPVRMMRAEAAALDSGVPVEAGERILEVEVTIVWEIAPASAAPQ